MPTYEYQCVDCGTKFEVRASITEKEKGLKPSCPTCGRTGALPLFSAVSVGSGSKGKTSSCCAGTGCCPPRR